MGSQANVIVKDKNERTSILLRVASDGATFLQDLVWLPLLHARTLRSLRSESITLLKEKWSRENDPRLSPQFRITSALHHFDRDGSMFGIGAEYISQIILITHAFNIFPLAKQRNAWGVDEKPVAQVFADIYTHNIIYELGPNESYSYVHDPRFIHEVHDDAAHFNEFFSSKITIDEFVGLSIETRKNGFECKHNELVAAILLNDLDTLKWPCDQD